LSFIYNFIVNFLNYFNNCCKSSDFVAKLSNFAVSFNMFCDMPDLYQSKKAIFILIEARIGSFDGAFTLF